MRLAFLKIELISQLVVIAICILEFATNMNDPYNGANIFIGFLAIGISNIVGFLIRILIVKSVLNYIYLFAVILSFLSFAFFEHISILLVPILGTILNFYYLIYGFILIKNWQPKAISKN